MSYATVPQGTGGGDDLPNYQRPSLSPSPDTANGGESIKHRRNYQACEGCRGRKVKCDLGPVDAPSEPPCARCRREKRKCVFADTRKKRNQSPSTNDLNDGHTDKRRRTASSSQDPNSFTPPDMPYHDPYNPPDPMYNIHAGFIQPQQSTTPPLSGTPPRSYHPSPTSRPMPRSVNQFAMNTPAKKDLDEVKSRATETLSHQTITTNYTALTALADVAKNLSSADSADVESRQRANIKQADSHSTADTPHRNRDGTTRNKEQMSAYRHALEVWSRMTFVRAGFFTAVEAIAYVDYFYDNLQSLTPVTIPDYRDVSKHRELLTREPILALTILTIASRAKELEGFSATSRQYTVHEHLWRSLTSKVQRLLWGQEQFGGGSGTAKVRELAGGQLTWTGSLRTLGTIEALLLLTDWQPRSLHFPPGNDDIRLLDRNFENGHENDMYAVNLQFKAGGSDNMPYSSWLEPAWRSDRMSWMLLGLAEALSFELGVFDEGQGRVHRNDPETARKSRIRRMVTVYIAQTSGRIGIPSPLSFDDDYTGHNLEGSHIDPVDVMHGLWTHIAGIMHQANKQIFPSREYTMQLTRGTQYRDRIATFAPQLEQWMEHYERVKDSIDPVMQCVLLMEYEYARLYINSIGLQHVLESWVRPGGTDPQSTSNMAKAVNDNKKYIEAFTEAALQILHIISGKMKDLGVLRDAPVRTFLRTLSAMMFTLKRLSLGNHERMVRRSIDLLEQVTRLLTTEVVDDVHLSAVTARMVEGILNKVKQTMIRVQKPPNTSGQPSREHSRAASPQHQSQHGDHRQQRYNNPSHPFSNGVPASTASFDPLAGIEARPMAALMDRTFIPPPNFNFDTNDFDASFLDDAGVDHSVHSEQLADWFTLPLEGIANKDGYRVDQGFHGIGPMVGQHDMLEVITQTPFDQNAMSWPGQDQLYQHF